MRTARSKAALRAGASVTLVFLAGIWLLVALNNKTSKVDPDLARLIKAKKIQVQQLAAAQTNPVPANVWKFFDAMERGQWSRSTNLYQGLLQIHLATNQLSTGLWAGLGDLMRQFLGRAGPPAGSSLQTALWCPVHETLGAGFEFNRWDGTLLHKYGRDIIESISPGSIYFGGTDPGRFAITALSESHQAAKPFFTLTQNALTDWTYLDYLGQMYGARIDVPTPDDLQQAIADYLEDAKLRLHAGKLMLGEDVRMVGGIVRVDGEVAIMQVNGRLAKIIFDKNPGRAFYVEESYPLDWMYPHLLPNGLILKLNREPQPELSKTMVAEDRKYWRQLVAELIGDWLTQETTLDQICDFGVRLYSQRDIAGFKGNPAFARNKAAQQTYSKMRLAIAGVYLWRAEHSQTDEEKGRMRAEADFAFHQALALGAFWPETAYHFVNQLSLYRYVNFLLVEQRPKDALAVAQYCLKMDPSDAWVRDLVERLKKAQ